MAATLRELLERLSRIEDRGIVLAGDRDRDQRLTWSSFAELVAGVATALEATLPRGAVVGVMGRPLLELAGFWACAVSGRTACLMPSPSLLVTPSYHRRVLPRMLSALAPAAVLTDAKTLEKLRPLLPAETLAGLRWLEAEELAGPGPVTGLDAIEAPEPGDRCYVQFSSGTAGVPKGVQLTHGNLLANLDAMASRLRATEKDVGVSWLPLHHDMGLIGGHLLPARLGMEHHLMKPMSFAARPWSWLGRLSRARATLSVAPSFAFDLCTSDSTLSRLGPDTRLDAVRAILDGSEPIRPGSPESFAAALASRGLCPGAVLPCYGLAEATLAVTIGEPGCPAASERVARAPLQRDGRAEAAEEDSTDALTFVGVGRPLTGVSVRISGPDGEVYEDGRVGEILAAGPSVTPGYLAGASPETFTTDEAGVRWLRTGDLGYTRRGMLHVTGRLKDVIVCRGRNQDPLELEEAADEVPGVRAGHTAAFSHVDPAVGREVVVVLVEPLEGAPAELERRVAERVAEVTGVVADAVRLVARGTIERTTSGKKRRAEAKARYLRDKGESG